MPLNVPPGYGIVAWRFALAGDPQEMVTTCGVDAQVFGSDTVEAVATNAAKAFALAFPAAQIDSDWVFRGCTAWRADADSNLVPANSVGVTVTGTAAGTTPIQNTAVLVRKRTAGSGRRKQGRFYFPAFGLSPSAYSAAGVLTSTAFNDYQTRFNTFYSALVNGNVNGMSGPVPPVLLHADAMDPDPITAFQLDQTLASQRRRLRR